ncbi:uncharacterized protein ATNIH1004_005521 [Aspergillus tanneri]|uniref:Uncharacterized protein n=1 Tax=Aspergillus tanneri TaxID=1220188 RepID=A0A5M9MLR5_9EURO|nr:uncharacterized protein ATNIH1004_005521 [Aspergillus tanneri]KAA8646846.1 hypothetical protein ATNIH1004_005521 [Aspergillus tanneri]
MSTAVDLYYIVFDMGKRVGDPEQKINLSNTIVTSVIRVTFLQIFSSESITWTCSSADFIAGELVDDLNWRSAKVGVAIVIASCPFFKALIGLHLPRLARLLGISRTKGSTAGSSGYGGKSRSADQHHSLHQSIRLGN